MNKLFSSTASSSFVAVLAPLLAGLAPGGARAEELSSNQRYAPPVLDVESRGRVRSSDAAPERSEADRSRVLVPQLRGIVFVDQVGAVKKKGALAADGVSVDAAPNAVPPGVKAAAAKYLGGAVTLGSLDDLTKALVLAYRAADRPVVNVVVPEQDITKGVVQILVVVGRLNEVRVEGAMGANADALTGAIRLVRGEPISEGALLDDLRYLNRNPFRRVDAIYQPGLKYGQTDIVLQDVEDKPYTVYAGTESKGGRGPLGDARPFIGAIEAGQLGLGEVLGYQYTTDPSFHRLESHVGSLTLPLPERLQFQGIAGYTSTKADLGSGLNETGNSALVGAYIVAPLPHYGAIAQDVRFGGEFKSINNNLDFGGATVTQGTPQIFQGVLGYTAEGVIFTGKTRFEANVYGSPGNITSSDTSPVFQQLRAGARAEYFYSRASVDSRYELGSDFRLLVGFTGQVASTNLLPTEQLVLGGIGSVRGFAYQDALVDSGVIANLTLFTPGTAVLRNFTNTPSGLVDELRGYAFIDHGSGFYHAPLIGQATYVGLTGVGLGITYEAAKYLNADVGYGFHVQNTGTDDREHGRWHFRVVARY